MIKTYSMLTKPGIIFGNVVTTLGGFALASKGDIDFFKLLTTLLGLSFIIASAGVFNNYLDREADAKMERTKNRPLATGLIPNPSALAFGLWLLLIGIVILGIYTNALTLGLSLLGFFIYLVLYAFMKYRSFYGTLVGSVAGAIPPLVGYTSISNQIDMGGIFIFLLVAVWQMPHFFAISIYRLEDYKAADIPVLPLQKGLEKTKIQMFFYIIAFVFVSLMLTVSGYTGYTYASLALFLGALWLWLCFQGFSTEESKDKRWAKKMFICSLVVIFTLSLAIPFDVRAAS
ncbi:heme o synthase [Criblamydia sequanensis]|uniref:Protoheme IX farnesyltransferase n=1 Tax=Candidatus Criblamydia sequanensis CRIB-18 TaxID=1437425 RepID=A0A090D110_9BACT|nr:heme o synthase [Criblamydia sequanensis]CDR35237.1 Protoheme IX farnesyltransferase [Criblamydia sequanensis CRIB-18]